MLQKGWKRLQESFTHCLVRRARPLLGTIVEIGAVGDDDSHCIAAIEAGFDAINDVQQNLSYYDPHSVIARFNRAVPGESTPIAQGLVCCIEAAITLLCDTNGLFSPFVLPETKTRVTEKPEDLLEIRSDSLLKLSPIELDLGGIAKGFAVDRGIEAMKSFALEQGSINAGGDVRVFGIHAQTIFIRNPLTPHRTVGSLELINSAVCTSLFRSIANFPVPGHASLRLTGENGAPVGVSVVAPGATYADALTKVFSTTQVIDSLLLDRFNAHALLITEDL